MMEMRRLLSLSIHFILFLTSLLPVKGFLARNYGAKSFHRWHLWARSPTTFSDSDTTTVLLRREPQVRKKSKNRHAPGYWQNITNVRSELFEFWTNLGVKTVSSNEPPPIPNEALLNHFERYDLKYAVVSYGGRTRLSKKLGGARIIPGRWTAAVESSPELQALLENETHMLSRTLPPLSPQQKREQPNESLTQVNRTRWNHSPKRKPKGYWTIETVLQELYQYLDDYQEHKNRPSVWMPRLGELKREGRDDLRFAITRFGGCNGICKLAGLVPYREWYYFEGQYELLVDLRDYLDKYHDGDYSSFPCASDMKRHGYHQLYSLTQFYGGSTFVANRFNMKYIYARNTHGDLKYGSFSIDTAIDLMRFIRAREMRKKGPLKRPTIAMPRQQTLLANGEDKLHDEIMEIGGYENVARRLGLAYFD